MWLVYGLSTVVAWAMWGFLGKIALKHVTWVQASIGYGVGIALMCAVVIFVGPKATSWEPSKLWVAGLSGLCAAIGLATFYLALERGKASIVVPMIGLYPALTAVLSVIFLSERLAPLQIVGLCLAVAATFCLAAS